MIRIIDISPLLNETTAVYPGDPQFQREKVMDYARGDLMQLSRVTMSLHFGAHVDAPVHYGKGTKGMSDQNLNRYLGPCQVIGVLPPSRKDGRVYPEDLGDIQISAPRVLLKTLSYPDSQKWTADFLAASPDLIDHLAQKGVHLIGIDTPSVDPVSSTKFESHAAVLKNDMAILEGIVLNEVEPGFYDLIALPLKIEGADGSPVRAILLPPNSFSSIA